MKTIAAIGCLLAFGVLPTAWGQTSNPNVYGGPNYFGSNDSQERIKPPESIWRPRLLWNRRLTQRTE